MISIPLTARGEEWELTFAMVDGDSSDSDEYEEDDSSLARCKVSVEIKSRDLPNTARANAVLRVGPWLSKPGDEYSRLPSSKPELIFTYRDAQPHVTENNTLTVAVGMEMASTCGPAARASFQALGKLNSHVRFVNNNYL